MTNDVGVKKVGARTIGAGLLVAAIGFVLLMAGVIGSGGVSAFSVLIIVGGLVVAAVGFARRVLDALENR